jgi:hypothetical protein
MRNGDVSGLLSPSNPFFGRAQVVIDPQTKQPFPGNIIPSDRISPNGRAMLNAYPLPTPGFQTNLSEHVRKVLVGVRAVDAGDVFVGCPMWVPAAVARKPVRMSLEEILRRAVRICAP